MILEFLPVMCTALKGGGGGGGKVRFRLSRHLRILLF